MAFVTQAVVQLESRPASLAGVLIGLRGLESLGDVVCSLLSLKPSALEFLDRSFLEVAHASVPFSLDGLAVVLVVDFEGPDTDTTHSMVEDAIQLTAEGASFAHRALSQEEHARMWALRHSASPVLAALPDSKRSLQVIEDGCVPVEKLGTYVSEVQGAANDARIDIVAFGHAGDGHLHVNALVDTTSEDFEHRVTTLFERVTEIVLQLGGTPSGEHGDGRLRAGTLRRLYGPEILELFRRVKLAFDPHGTMNPGVVLPCDDASPIQALKVGPDAASISPHIAAGLRRLERTGGWGIPKLELLAGEKSR